MKWTCEKRSEHDYREEGGEGFSITYTCVNELGEKGWAYAIINPSICHWAYLVVCPDKQGIGSTVLPLIEEEMRSRGCKKISCIPTQKRVEDWLIRHGYKPGEGEYTPEFTKVI